MLRRFLCRLLVAQVVNLMVLLRGFRLSSKGSEFPQISEGCPLWWWPQESISPGLRIVEARRLGVYLWSIEFGRSIWIRGFLRIPKGFWSWYEFWVEEGGGHCPLLLATSSHVDGVSVEFPVCAEWRYLLDQDRVWRCWWGADVERQAGSRRLCTYPLLGACLFDSTFVELRKPLSCCNRDLLKLNRWDLPAPRGVYLEVHHERQAEGAHHVRSIGTPPPAGRELPTTERTTTTATGNRRSIRPRTAHRQQGEEPTSTPPAPTATRWSKKIQQ